MKTLLGLAAILAALSLAACGNGNNANNSNNNNANGGANANQPATMQQPQTFGNTQGNPHAIRVPPANEMATPPNAATRNQPKTTQPSTLGAPPD
ncbi:MAG TPA: hypothetical protein VFM97_09165 [Gammaproteobacteria bacterium]|nr:hypothetical protein [Gammaproteobacteria bacterium]